MTGKTTSSNTIYTTDNTGGTYLRGDGAYAPVPQTEVPDKTYQEWVNERVYKHGAQYFLDTTNNGYILRRVSDMGQRSDTWCFQSKQELVAFILKRLPDPPDFNKNKGGGGDVTATAGGN